MVNSMERLTEKELRNGTTVFPQCQGCFGDCVSCEYQDNANEKMKHYEDLEEQGLLLKMPCKIGDVVYSTEYGEVKEFTVTNFRVYKTEVCAYDGYSYIGEVGVSVFTTKAEAEKALAEMEK